MASRTESLICWLQTFPIEVHGEVKELADGVVLSQVLSQIAPDHFDSTWLSHFKTCAENNWQLKVRNLKKILVGAIEYYSEVEPFPITGFTLPDINEIAENNNALELGKLIQLVLGCAVNCLRKKIFIEVIMSMGQDVQHHIMNAIQELTNAAEAPSACFSCSAANEAKELMHRCHELDMQVKKSVLQEKKKLEGKQDMEEQVNVARLHDCRYAKMLNLLQGEIAELETVGDEYRLSAEERTKEIFDLQHKNNELQKLARSLKDELDELRHLSDKVESYETTILTYKKKLEDSSTIKQQNKQLEVAHATHIQQTMELEEELKKSNMYKNMYKKQIQDLQAKVVFDTKRADENRETLENQRQVLVDKYSSLQREKESLIEERNSLKTEIEELTCTIRSQEQLTSNGVEWGRSFDVALLDVSPEIKEKIIRLKHENEMLKLKNSAQQNKLEVENRLATELEDLRSACLKNRRTIRSEELQQNPPGASETTVEAENATGRLPAGRRPPKLNVVQPMPRCQCHVPNATFSMKKQILCSTNQCGCYKGGRKCGHLCRCGEKCSQKA